MNIQIITPEKNLYNGEAKMVVVPGSKGSFGILNNHAPLISTLNEGDISITTFNEKIETFTIKSGVVEILNNKIVILATL